MYCFRLEGCAVPQMLKQNSIALDYTADYHSQLDTPAAIRVYFKQLYSSRGTAAFDIEHILDAFRFGISGCEMPFAQVAEKFRLIKNAAYTVYIPIADGVALCEHLRQGFISRTLLRQLGIYSISCYPEQFEALKSAGALELLPNGSAILTDPNQYSSETGLKLDVETGIGVFF